MRISDIRRKNVENIINTKCNGVKAEFARRMKKEPQVVARWWASNPKQRRNVGDVVAREIEEEFNLEDGWMDAQHNIGILEKNSKNQKESNLQRKKTYSIPLRYNALLNPQQLTLTFIQKTEGNVMLLSTDKDVWAFVLLSTHQQTQLNKGWGVVVEPNTPITNGEYALITLQNDELMLRLVVYQDEQRVTAHNPITHEQITYDRTTIKEINYAYIGIPPSKINQ